MSDIQTPKQFSNRTLILLIIIISVATAIIIIALNYETITNTATVTSILTNFPIQLFNEGYDMICLDNRNACLVKMSDHMQYTTDTYLGKEIHSFRAINDTTIQLFDSEYGYEKKYTSYHFYTEFFKITTPLNPNFDEPIWFVERK